jgi:hypothetical protein
MKLLLLLPLMALACSGFSQTDTSNQLVYFSTGYYKIEYPKSWRIDTSKQMGTELILFSLLEDQNDKFRENVNVMIQDLTGQDINLDKYKQLTEEQLKVMATEGVIFESSIIKSGNENYYKITYAMTQGNFRLKITSLCYIKGEKALLTTFTAELKKYDQYKKTGEGILNSFSVIR